MRTLAEGVVIRAQVRELVLERGGYHLVYRKEARVRDFPGGAVVKNPPASAGDTGSIPGPGRFHMSPSN